MTQTTLNSLAPSASTNSSSIPGTPSRRIVEMPMRLFHTLIALSFLGAYLTAESERFRLLHVSLGYTLFGLVVFRLLWGMFGPRQSRLSVAWRKLEALKELKNDFQNFPEAVLKWNAQTFRKWTSLLLTLAAFSTFLVSIFITLSGYAIYNEIAGDWMSEIHEFSGNFLLMAVLLHIALVMLLVLSKKSQGLRPMWSGRREGAGPDVAKSNHVCVSILLGMAVMSFLFFQLT